MTTWFHRYRRMRQKLAAMTELNQALCEANMELMEKIERLENEIKVLRATNKLNETTIALYVDRYGYKK